MHANIFNAFNTFQFIKIQVKLIREKHRSHHYVVELQCALPECKLLYYNRSKLIIIGFVFAVGHGRPRTIPNDHIQLLPRCSWNYSRLRCNGPGTVNFQFLSCTVTYLLMITSCKLCWLQSCFFGLSCPVTCRNATESWFA